MPNRLVSGADVSCLLTLGAGSDVKANALPFGQGLETRTLDCGKMGEKIIAAVFRSNEAEALGIVKPLYSTCCHVLKLLNKNKGGMKKCPAPQGRWSRRQGDEG